MKPFRFLADAFDVSSARELGERARAAEDLGVTAFVLPDHLVPQLAPVPYLATVAALTERLRISAFVHNNDLRHPAVLAQELATLDVLSERPAGRRDRGRLESSPSTARSAWRSIPSGSGRRGWPRRSRSSRAASARVRSRSPASTTRSPTTTPTRSRCRSRTRRSSSAAAGGRRWSWPRARRDTSGLAPRILRAASTRTRHRSPGRRPRRSSSGSGPPPATGSTASSSTSTRRSGRSSSPTTSAARPRKVIDAAEGAHRPGADRAGGHRLAAHLHRLGRSVRREVQRAPRAARDQLVPRRRPRRARPGRRAAGRHVMAGATARGVGMTADDRLDPLRAALLGSCCASSWLG